MEDVFRILDRFKIIGVGTIFLIKNHMRSVISVGDIFYDIQGNRFKVTGIEIPRCTSESMDFEDLPLGLRFEQLDGVEVAGNILVRSSENLTK